MSFRSSRKEMALFTLLTDPWNSSVTLSSIEPNRHCFHAADIKKANEKIS